MEEKVVDYLLEKYKPHALLVHGSRANGNARPRSDWDFAVFVSEPIEQVREVLFESENIDMRVFTLPISDEDIKKYCFYFHNQNVRVLHDPAGITSDIIQKATDYFNSPRIPTSSQFISGCNRLRALINGMRDYQAEHLAFFRKLAEFYQWSLTYWFWFVSNSYMQQVYRSLPTIKLEDPEYFHWLEILSNHYSNEEKIEAAEKIYNRLDSLKY